MPASPPVRRVVAAAAGLLLAVGLAGCSGPGDGSASEPSGPAGPAATPLAERDLQGLALRRTAFCGELAEGAADAAVGGQVDRSVEYDPGDRVEVVPGTTDVAHEFACGYTAEGGAAARAWVFAPPTTPKTARGLVRTARKQHGCAVPPGAADFGQPSLALVCSARGTSTASYRGLFGDAWVTCSVSARGAGDDALVERAEAWCGAVVDALS